MLQSRHVIFTAFEGTLFDPGSQGYAAAEEALGEIDRRHVPLVLCSGGNRAQLDPQRRNLGHAHPFLTENGGGLFFPDGYFSLHLEGAVRVARYFCMRFGRSHAEAAEAVQEIATEVEAEVVAFSQMTAREIARNTGQSLRDAELARQCEFSERFFFAGDVDTSAARFTESARERGWLVRPGQPFWELFSGNDAGKAVRYLMRLYRSSLHTKLTSVGIGSAPEHLPLLQAVDLPVILPQRGQKFDQTLVSSLPRAILGSAAGAAGWNQVVLDLWEQKQSEKIVEAN